MDGVCTFCEMAVPLVARLAEKLGLPGNSPQAVDAARDKHSTRAVMQAAGLPTPRNMLISEPEDVKKAAEEVCFPAGVHATTCWWPGDEMKAEQSPGLSSPLPLSVSLCRSPGPFIIDIGTRSHPETTPTTFSASKHGVIRYVSAARQ